MKNIRFSAMKNEDEKMEIEINDNTQKVKKKNHCFKMLSGCYGKCKTIKDNILTLLKLL